MRRDPFEPDDDDFDYDDDYDGADDFDDDLDAELEEDDDSVEICTCGGELDEAGFCRDCGADCSDEDDEADDDEESGIEGEF